MLIFRDLEQKIIKIINESGLPIDAIYFIMKSLIQEIEQKYFEFCRQEEIENTDVIQKNLENNKEEQEELVSKKEESDKLE